MVNHFKDFVDKHYGSHIEITDNHEEKRIRMETQNYQTMNVDVLYELLKQTKSIHDEADILHFLFETK
jgi:hypothetical protein